MKIFSGVFPIRLGKPVENAETIINIINEHNEKNISNYNTNQLKFCFLFIFAKFQSNETYQNIKNFPFSTRSTPNYSLPL